MLTKAALIYLSVTMRELQSAMSDAADDDGTDLFSGTRSGDFTELRSVGKGSGNTFLFAIE